LAITRNANFKDDVKWFKQLLTMLADKSLHNSILHDIESLLHRGFNIQTYLRLQDYCMFKTVLKGRWHYANLLRQQHYSKQQKLNPVLNDILLKHLRYKTFSDDKPVELDLHQLKDVKSNDADYLTTEMMNNINELNAELISTCGAMGLILNGKLQPAKSIDLRKILFYWKKNLPNWNEAAVGKAQIRRFTSRFYRVFLSIVIAPHLNDFERTLVAQFLDTVEHIGARIVNIMSDHPDKPTTLQLCIEEALSEEINDDMPTGEEPRPQKQSMFMMLINQNVNIDEKFENFITMIKQKTQIVTETTVTNVDMHYHTANGQRTLSYNRPQME
ncbi:unnamed protein product, partial [Didymodactylos carnosus]